MRPVSWPDTIAAQDLAVDDQCRSGYQSSIYNKMVDLCCFRQGVTVFLKRVFLYLIISVCFVHQELEKKDFLEPCLHFFPLFLMQN